MPELDIIETPKSAGFIDRGYNNSKKRAAMEAEEKEIERLEAEARGETIEEESDGEGSETTEVSDASDTEQKEAKEKTEASESDEGLSREEKSFKKRYGDLRRHMSEKEKDWQEKFEDLEARMKGENIIPPKSDEDIDAWASEHPDIAGIVETIAAKKAQQLFSKAEARLQQLDKMNDETMRKSAEVTILESHSDFITIRESDSFHDWAEEQPKWVQDAVYENADDPRSVIRVIDLYKVDKGLTKEAKKASKKAAASMVSRTSKTKVDADEAGGQIRESDVAKMSSTEFEENQDNINKAMRNGKFVYDISGNAR